MTDNGGTGDVMNHGHGWNEDDADGSMMGGGGAGGGHMDAMSVIMELLTSADERLVDRVVQPLLHKNTSEQVGVETFTTSSDPSVASNIQLHVAITPVRVIERVSCVLRPSSQHHASMQFD